MNRAEQIIGRAVRTCSHKDLPFSERNVEIFLHGTLLGSEVEAADLYVYRLAELKALQIGRVTRLLKEVSVDCILNIFERAAPNPIIIVKVRIANKTSSTSTVTWCTVITKCRAPTFHSVSIERVVIFNGVYFLNL